MLFLLCRVIAGALAAGTLDRAIVERLAVVVMPAIEHAMTTALAGADVDPHRAIGLDVDDLRRLCPMGVGPCLETMAAQAGPAFTALLERAPDRVTDLLARVAEVEGAAAATPDTTIRMVIDAGPLFEARRRAAKKARAAGDDEHRAIADAIADALEDESDGHAEIEDAAEAEVEAEAETAADIEPFAIAEALDEFADDPDALRILLAAQLVDQGIEPDVLGWGDLDECDLGAVAGACDIEALRDAVEEARQAIPLEW